jgi:hypothetical protein
VLSLIFACVALATPAHALPAPMSDQELMEKSDLVAVVRVLSVTCTTVRKDDKTGEELPSYLARLKLIEVKKGSLKPGEEVLVTWHAIPKGIVGPWVVYYYPGEKVLTHLVKPAVGVAYASTWWNAKGENITAPASKELPVKPGETLEAPAPEDRRMPL